eukprot:TRINITY_DN32806_c0_g1_i1.p1 TRINITY_DN32806_c0_g1~~TRINITY_DN32806_c0_g1_i1.p1  ORF type:complete len:527 (+),score=155.52 TRINITY_DN32806_c0_g1_i1:302-1882(+)
MEDDDDDFSVPQTRVHFGEVDYAPDRTTSVDVAVAPEQEIILSEQSERSRREQETLIREIERQHRSKLLAVPTDDGQVRGLLRRLGEPITLFGEREHERRARLRTIMADREILHPSQLEGSGMEVELGTMRVEGRGRGRQEDDEGIDDVGDDDEEGEQQTHYTEGPAELIHERRRIAEFSLRRAAERIQKERGMSSESKSGMETEEKKEEELEESRVWEDVECELSIPCDRRPSCFVKFHPTSPIITTASFSGLIQWWDAENGTQIASFSGHEDRVASLSYFHHRPGFVSAGLLDQKCCIWIEPELGDRKRWPLVSKPQSVFSTSSTHFGRIAAVDIHPMDAHLAMSCYDHTWSLWSLERQCPLYSQEGHRAPVHGLSFQGDGSLLATSDTNGTILIWDLRTGCAVIALQGHASQVNCIDWAPNGFVLGSGSEDCTVRLWDLRAKESLYVIPAHERLVSSLRFSPDGKWIISSSFDDTCKIWSQKTLQLQKVLQHASHVMSADLDSKSNTAVSVCVDRNLKIWKNI